MHILIDRDPLLAALALPNAIVERRKTIPILGNLLLEASADGGDRLMVMATDLDIEVRASIEAKVDTAGATTVPAHLLFDIARKLPAGSEISLRQDGGHLEVKCGRSRYRLQTLPAADMPNISAGELPARLDLTAERVATMHSRLAFAISTKETRYYLNGIFLHRDADDLVCVATDGHKLACDRLSGAFGGSGAAGDWPAVILPRKTAEALARALKGAKGEIVVEASDTKIRFTFGAMVLTSKLIDGTYPDYGPVVPAGNEIRARLDRAELAAALGLVATVPRIAS